MIYFGFWVDDCHSLFADSNLYYIWKTRLRRLLEKERMSYNTALKIEEYDNSIFQFLFFFLPSLQRRHNQMFAIWR